MELGRSSCSQLPGRCTSAPAASARAGGLYVILSLRHFRLARSWSLSLGAGAPRRARRIEGNKGDCRAVALAQALSTKEPASKGRLRISNGTCSDSIVMQSGGGANFDVNLFSIHSFCHICRISQRLWQESSTFGDLSASEAALGFVLRNLPRQRFPPPGSDACRGITFRFRLLGDLADDKYAAALRNSFCSEACRTSRDDTTPKAPGLSSGSCDSSLQ